MSCLAWTSTNYTMPNSPHLDIVWMVGSDSKVDSIQSNFNQGLAKFSQIFLESAPMPGQALKGLEFNYKMAVSAINPQTNQLFYGFDDPITADCSMRDSQNFVALLWRGSNGSFVNSPNVLSSASYRADKKRFLWLFTGDTSGYNCNSWSTCSMLRGTSVADTMGNGDRTLAAPAKLIPGLDFAYIRNGFCQQLYPREASVPAFKMIWQTLLHGSQTSGDYRGITQPLFGWEMFPAPPLSPSPTSNQNWTIFVVIANQDDNPLYGWASVGSIKDSDSSFLGAMSSRLKILNRDPNKLRIFTVVPPTASRFVEASQKTHGQSFDVNGDFGVSLASLSKEAVLAANSIPLSIQPLIINGKPQIEVTYDGKIRTEGVDYLYDASTWSIRFVRDDGTLKILNRPSLGSKVIVRVGRAQ